MQSIRRLAASFLLLACALCGPAFAVGAKEADSSQVVTASWYGGEFNGRRTASGEIFDQNRLTAAHRSLPFGTRLRVTNLRNGRSVLVTITDRGPYCRNRQLDLSLGAARRLDLVRPGTAPVLIERL